MALHGSTAQNQFTTLYSTFHAANTRNSHFEMFSSWKRNSYEYMSQKAGLHNPRPWLSVPNPDNSAHTHTVVVMMSQTHTWGVQCALSRKQQWGHGTLTSSLIQNTWRKKLSVETKPVWVYGDWVTAASAGCQKNCRDHLHCCFCLHLITERILTYFTVQDIFDVS